MSDSTPTLRATKTPTLRAVATPAHTSRVYFVAVLAITTVLGVMWSCVAKRQLDGALAASAAESFDRAHALFDVLRTRTQDSLRSQCGVLVEDPRLKSTLAIEGIDEATVADILTELGRLRRSGFLLVLTPEGRVFAEAGAPELRGLDLSASSMVKKARGAHDTVVGSWVIGGKIIDLAITAIQFDQNAFAYLVLGQAVDTELVDAVTAGTGVAASVIAGTEASPLSTTDDRLRVVLQTIPHISDAAHAHAVEFGGAHYFIATVELEDTVPSRPRLALARALGPTRKPFAAFAWLLWAPIGLSIIGVVIAGQRSRYRAL